MAEFIGLLSGFDNREFACELSFLQGLAKKGTAFRPFLFWLFSASTLYCGPTIDALRLGKAYLVENRTDVNASVINKWAKSRGTDFLTTILKGEDNRLLDEETGYILSIPLSHC